MKKTFTNIDFIYPLDTDPVAAGLHTFCSTIRGKKQNVNWYYTKNYRGNLPSSLQDSRDFHHAFDSWIKNCENWIQEGSIAIDIGGFTGDTALPLAYLVGDEGKVLVFEPHPINFEELSRNISANPSLNIDAFNVAIMKEEGEFEFLYQTDGHGAKNGGPSGNGLWTTVTQAYPEKVIVPGVKLTKILEQYPNKKISFIKIDTEGYDGDIILNIKEVIEVHRPAILTEWLPGAERKLLLILELFKYKAVNPETQEAIEIGPNTRVQDILLLPI